MILSFLSIVATSYIRTATIEDEVAVHKWIDRVELESIVAGVMAEKNVSIDTLYWTKGDKLKFDWSTEIYTIVPSTWNPYRHGTTIIEILRSDSRLKFVVTLTVINREIDSLHRIVAWNRVILPLKDTLAKLR